MHPNWQQQVMCTVVGMHREPIALIKITSSFFCLFFFVVVGALPALHPISMGLLPLLKPPIVD